MKHRLFTFASALSLLMCVLVIVAWFSTISGERVLNSPRVHVSLLDSGIAALVDHGKARDGDRDKRWEIWKYALPRGSGSDDSVWGFNFETIDYPHPATKFGLPYWLLGGVFAVLPWRWFVLHRREKRRAMIGCCSACGYDLRASSERCSECGKPTALSA